MIYKRIILLSFVVFLGGCMTARRAFNLREYQTSQEARENAETLLDYLGKPTCNPNTRAQALESCVLLFAKAGFVHEDPAFYENLRRVLLEESSLPKFKPDCANSNDVEYQKALALKMLGVIGSSQALGDVVDWLDHSTFEASRIRPWICIRVFQP